MTGPLLHPQRAGRGRDPRPAIATVVAALILAAGCGGPPPNVVSGRVLVEGEPAGGVYLVFHAGGDARESGSARSGDDGAFRAVVDATGESAVTAFWPTATVRGQDYIEGPDRFGGAYRDPGRPVATVTVREGETALEPIALPSPAKSRVRSRR